MLTGALFFTSCTEDTILEEHQIEMSGEGIYFGLPETNNSWEPDSRSAKKGDKFVMRSEESTDTLCVSTSTINGIHTSNDVQSRGARKNDLVESGFNVTAYYYPAGASTPSSILFNEDVTVANDGSTGMTTTYYWPKEGGFTFLATANGDDNLTINDKNGEGFITTPSLSYTVPGNVSDQKDAMVAFTGTTTINNNNNGAAVPLTFTHLCAAVQFQLTSEVENTIESIVISGVKGGTLTYTYSNGVWTPSTPTKDASYTISTTQDGTTITSDNDGTTLLLAPQTLTADATITVNFSDGRDAVFTEADALTGNVWEMGKTFIYKLTITPEYTLEFISKPMARDAHYDIYTFTIKAEDIPEGGWTLTSNDTENVTFVEIFEHNSLKEVIDQGYWLEEYIGTSSLTSSSSGEIQIYAFLKENITEKDREITLSLTPNNIQNVEAKTFTFTQYCPAWNNGIGVERIQEKDYSWGFNWDSSMKVTYSMPNTITSAFIHVLFSIFGDHSYIEQSGLVITRNWKVTVDFSKVPTLTTANDENDGITNTWQLYTFNGINDASTIMNQLESWGGTADKELPTNPAEFAAWACAKKNKYNTEKETENGEPVYKPVLTQENMLWYLPARTEALNMNDNLEGDYWTSTAITTPGTTAYKYTANGDTSGEDRNKEIHVRAIRKKQ